MFYGQVYWPSFGENVFDPLLAFQDQHVEEVRKVVNERPKEILAKSMQRMEVSMMNKQKQLDELMLKLQEHVSK